MDSGGPSRESSEVWRPASQVGYGPYSAELMSGRGGAEIGAAGRRSAQARAVWGPGVIGVVLTRGPLDSRHEVRQGMLPMSTVSTLRGTLNGGEGGRGEGAATRLAH